jgi:transposase
MIAVCRLRHRKRTRAYATKRTADGLNRREILRCLKRYIARETYHTLRADLEALNST